MGHAGVVGGVREHAVQDLRGFLLLGVRLVVHGRGAEDGEGVEDRRLAVCAVPLVHARHGLLEGACPRHVVGSVRVESTHRRDVVALPGVGAPAAEARPAASLPLWSSAGVGAAAGLAEAQMGWKSDIAMPQSAIPHFASTLRTSEKAFSDSS